MRARAGEVDVGGLGRAALVAGVQQVHDLLAALHARLGHVRDHDALHGVVAQVQVHVVLVLHQQVAALKRARELTGCSRCRSPRRTPAASSGAPGPAPSSPGCPG